MEYSVFTDDGKSVGTVAVESVGLYCRISCSCKLPIQRRWRLLVKSETGETDLGLCSKRDGGTGLYTCLPRKKLGEGALRFIIREERIFHGDFVALAENEPCPCISRLREGKLACCKGTVGISFIK